MSIKHFRFEIVMVWLRAIDGVSSCQIWRMRKNSWQPERRKDGGYNLQLALFLMIILIHVVICFLFNALSFCIDKKKAENTSTAS